MSRYHSYIASASSIIEGYTADEPFVHYIRKYFAANKKYGSRDRKIIASLCYSYFRTAHAFKDEPLQERILKGIFLCEYQPNAVLEAFHPEWNQQAAAAPGGKWKLLCADPASLFPFTGELGEIDEKGFTASFLVQPLLYLRARPGKTQKLLTALEAAAIPYRLAGEQCLVLQNATSLDKLLRFNKDVVVQDLNSQKVFDTAFESGMLPPGQKAVTWDCCAASGGKSILLYDKMDGKLELTVSDIRTSILANLKRRLQEAGVPLSKTFIADLTAEIPKDVPDFFDIIICDAPCTGSGTWSRTPEQLAYFKQDSIETYAEKQKKIASNAISRLAENGVFFYITCSVFKKENEEVVSFLQSNSKAQLISQQYLKGYEMQADTMFVAVFKK